VQEAIKLGLGLAARPTAKQMIPLAEPWRPLRGAAAHLWWSYYRAIKQREGVLGGATTPAKPNDVSNNVVVAKRSSSRDKIAARTSPRSKS
jgi:DNA-3-methyladenine glycosylase II